MADEVSTEQTGVVALADPIKAEIDQQMAIALNGGLAPVSAEITGKESLPSDPGAVITASDPFGLFKEKFGYETPEAAIQEIETLRAFRAAPPAAELKFENEQSKTLAEAIQAGKLNEVYEVLDQQMKIDRLTTGEVTPEIAADIVRLGMQLKFKDLTQAEINYKFNKTFGIPAKPSQTTDEDQEDFNARLSVWEAQKQDKEMELIIEAKVAKPELLNTKAKLVFPTIARPQDAEFQDWQKTNQELERQAVETTEAYKAFTPKSLATKINFKDEPNKIDFDFMHEPDPQSFNTVMEMVADIDVFWKHFIGSDGNPNRKGFAEALYFGLNKDKILMDAMNQAKNATIKASLPDNSSGGLVRQMPQTQEVSELDAMMRASLKGYAGF